MNRRIIKLVLFFIFVMFFGFLIYKMPLFIGCLREYDEELPVSPGCWQFRLNGIWNRDAQSITGSIIGFPAENAIEVSPKELPRIKNTRKEIKISIAEQKMKLWQDDKIIKEYIISTGKNATPTRKGNFDVLSKHEIAYGCGIDGQCWKMPYWLGIYMVGNTENGIHELPFINIGGVYYRESENSLGNKVSHGCIRLAIGAAKEVYDWAEVGTPVIIY